jgi:hypothetical protein
VEEYIRQIITSEYFKITNFGMECYFDGVIFAGGVDFGLPVLLWMAAGQEVLFSKSCPGHAGKNEAPAKLLYR